MIFAPPHDRTTPYIEIRREVGLDDLEVTYPDGNSYDLSLEEMRLLLVQLGVKPRVAEKALDVVWNFYALRLDLVNQTYTTLEPPSYPETMGPRPLEEFAWVFESEKAI